MMWLFKNEARCCPKRQFPTCISEAEMESKFNSVFAIKLEANMISVIGDALNQTLTMTLYYPRHEYEPLKGIVAQNYLGEAKLLMNNIRIFKKFLIHEEEILLRDKLEKMGFFTIFCQRCYEQLDSCACIESQVITELSLDQTSTTYITLEETKGQSNASIISENYFLVPENFTVTSKTERFTECSLCLKSNGGRKDIECENNHILCDECNNIFRSVAYSICPSCIKMKLDECRSPTLNKCRCCKLEKNVFRIQFSETKVQKICNGCLLKNLNKLEDKEIHYPFAEVNRDPIFKIPIIIWLIGIENLNQDIIARYIIFYQKTYRICQECGFPLPKVHTVETNIHKNCDKIKDNFKRKINVSTTHSKWAFWK